MNENVPDLLVCIASRGVYKAATAEEEAGSEHKAGQEVGFPHDDKRRRSRQLGNLEDLFQDRARKRINPTTTQ